MACFLIPTAEAIATTIATKIIEKGEKGNAKESQLHISNKLRWLSNMLWGGSILLAFEHVWHGEVTPWFPFLSAMSNSEDTASMLHEMSTVGVSMALVVTAVWIAMVLVSNSMERKSKHIAQRND
ncbi:MAG: hypothetical protein LIO71_02010 [Ruminococcus sp.]|nr:hypothetical protein [Ruminococcus sp.]MCD7799814.1 hypothetical protein [Ruminococcus sp.]